MDQNHSLKTLHDDRSECNWPVVIQTPHWAPFGNWDDGGGFKADVACESDRLKMGVSSSASSVAHALKAHQGMLSGPAVLSGLILYKALCMSADETVTGGGL